MIDLFLNLSHFFSLTLNLLGHLKNRLIPHRLTYLLETFLNCAISGHTLFNSKGGISDLEKLSIGRSGVI